MLHASSRSSHSHRFGRRAAPAVAAELLPPHRRSGGCGAATRIRTPNASVIATWNEMAVTTVNGGGGEPDELQLLRVRAPRHVQRRRGHHRRVRAVQVGRRGAEGCVARGCRRGRGAHRILTNYFPGINTANLDAQLAASLANVQNPVARANGSGVRGRSSQPHHRPADGRRPGATVPVADGDRAGRMAEPTPPGFRARSDRLQDRHSRRRHPDRPEFGHPVRPRCASGTHRSPVPR